MKIEIDTNNPAALERLERELDIALGTVRHAIEKLKQKANSSRQSHTRQIVEAQVSGATDGGISVSPKTFRMFSESLEQLPIEFTTNQLLEAVEQKHPKAGQIAIRRALSQSVEQGMVELIEKGSGRRPSTYRKVKNE
jgi:hypothetical protein